MLCAKTVQDRPAGYIEVEQVCGIKILTGTIYFRPPKSTLTPQKCTSKWDRWCASSEFRLNGGRLSNTLHCDEALRSNGLSACANVSVLNSSAITFGALFVSPNATFWGLSFLHSVWVCLLTAGHLDAVLLWASALPFLGETPLEGTVVCLSVCPSVKTCIAQKW